VDSDVNQEAAAEDSLGVGSVGGDRSSGWKFRWIIVLAALVLGAAPLMPAWLSGEGSDLAEFSAGRTLNHVEVIAQEPHPMGGAEIVQVRDYLIETLTDLGLSPVVQTVPTEDYYEVPGRQVDAVNVMARIEGVNSTGAVALVAHYDTVPATPGANDCSGCVATLLEIARILVASPPMANDVILLFTDGEEPAPRPGSTTFVADHPWFGDVAFVVNIEATGSGGPSLLIETSGSEEQMIGLYTDAPHPAAFSFVSELADLVGGFGTDFDPFKDNGVDGMSFAYAHGASIYHTQRDSVESVSLTSLQQQGANTLYLARRAGNADLEQMADSNGAVFFTIVGSTIVQYSDAVALALSLIAAVILGVAIVRHQRNQGGVVGRAFKSAGLVFGLFVASIAVGGLAWTVVAGWRPTQGVVEGYLYLLLMLAAGIGLWMAVSKYASRRNRAIPILGGVVLVWVALAVVTSLLAPGTSYLFVWPALAGATYLLANPCTKALDLVAFAAVTTTLLIVNTPAIDIFYQMAQPRPGNPDSQLMPVAGVALGMWVLIVAMIQTTHATASEREVGNGVITEHTNRATSWTGTS